LKAVFMQPFSTGWNCYRAQCYNHFKFEQESDTFILVAMLQAFNYNYDTSFDLLFSDRNKYNFIKLGFHGCVIVKSLILNRSMLESAEIKIWHCNCALVEICYCTSFSISSL